VVEVVVDAEQAPVLLASACWWFLKDGAKSPEKTAAR
jgi:hypothetical protein